MSIRQRLVTGGMLAVLGVTPFTRVDAQAFNGSIDVALPNFARVPDLARCGANPPNVREDWPSTPGTSTFGAFLFASSNCLDTGTGSHFNGLFTFDFGGSNTLFGTYLGQAAVPLPPPVGVANGISDALTILGGTGAYAGAGGTLSKVGTFTRNADNTFTLRQSLTGTVSTVPEPATVLLLAGGLVGVGVVARRRRRVPADSGGSAAAR